MPRFSVCVWLQGHAIPDGLNTEQCGGIRWCHQAILLMQTAATHLASKASIPTPMDTTQENQNTCETASATTKHIQQRQSWLQHVHIGRLQAFACINFASATLPRSWVNKDASIEVLLGLSFDMESKSTTKIC